MSGSLKQIISNSAFSSLHALYRDWNSFQCPDWAGLMQNVAYQPENMPEIFLKACVQVCSGNAFLKSSVDLCENDLSIESLLFKIQSQMAECSEQCVSFDKKLLPKKINLSEKMVHFFDLKRVARKGWTRAIPAFSAGVGTGVETVDQHCVKTALLASMLCSNSFEHVFLMGLVHDHAELVIGDLTPSEVSNRAEKKALERKVYLELLEASDMPEISKDFFKQAFCECMTDKTVESQWIHVADKLDMAMQAYTYEKRFNLDLMEFYDSAEEDITRSLYMITSKSFCDS